MVLHTHLEAHPDGVDLGSGPGEGGRAGPNGEQADVAPEQLVQRLRDGALVLVTGHHEVEDDERGEAQEAQHADEGEPVHFPEDPPHTGGYFMGREHSLTPRGLSYI